MPDLPSATGSGWASGDRPELAQHGALLLAGAASTSATALVVQMAPQPWVEPAVCSVDRLVDRLVAHGFASSDRHRRLPVLHQAPGDPSSQPSVFYEPRGLGSTSTAFRSTLRSRCHIACPPAVAVHFPSDRRHRPPEPPGDLAQGLASHQPDPDLLALFQPEAPTWHAGTSTGGCFPEHRPSWPECRNHQWNQRPSTWPRRGPLRIPRRSWRQAMARCALQLERWGWRQPSSPDEQSTSRLSTRPTGVTSGRSTTARADRSDLRGLVADRSRHEPGCVGPRGPRGCGSGPCAPGPRGADGADRRSRGRGRP
jgi:hypothetical protein